MSSVYVEPASRGHGIGTALVSRVVAEARENGFSSLYLWTPNKERYYAKRGWAGVERTRYKKEDVLVMQHLTG